MFIGKLNKKHTTRKGVYLGALLGPPSFAQQSAGPGERQGYSGCGVLPEGLGVGGGSPSLDGTRRMGSEVQAGV